MKKKPSSHEEKASSHEEKASSHRPTAVKERPAAISREQTSEEKANSREEKANSREDNYHGPEAIIVELATRGLAAQDGTVARIDKTTDRLHSFADRLQMRLAQQEWIKKDHEARLKRVEEHLDMVGP